MSAPIEIDEDLCIGCGRCAADCVGDNLRVEEGLARVRGRCILCGHCVAVCPTSAVSIPGYDMADVEDAVPASETLDAAALLRAVKSRRSVRSFRAEPVSCAELEFVLQAGRYTATAKNAQGCRFIVVQDGLAELKRLVWDGIEELLALPADEKPRWAKLYKPFLRDARAGKRDFLFRDAPAVVYVAAERADDAGLAAQNMELMAATLGLGVLFNGYLCRASEELPAVRTFLETGEKPLQMCLLLGRPAVTYACTAPRLPGDFVVK
ncbi:nitroreductase family protein [Arabiibacter massiliensis]|uniref:nitroreductase family protein n=1 Tax=Arabiibacter massiliensis TaxID=1870985 RepID=UPI000B425C69|nr:nitroreductase family protein [Arabiibacter massiliensis]